MGLKKYNTGHLNKGSVKVRRQRFRKCKCVSRAVKDGQGADRDDLVRDVIAFAKAYGLARKDKEKQIWKPNKYLPQGQKH